VGVPAHIVKVAGQRVAFASSVDQIHITDPVNETMKSLLSRVEFLERELDHRKGMDYEKLKNHAKEET
jgi:serine O-acetyltransferase